MKTEQRNNLERFKEKISNEQLSKISDLKAVNAKNSQVYLTGKKLLNMRV